ncbi:hypothetical protein [Pseudophaeobacter sp. C1-32P7]|uniref:hypothetical protein n=1 Tax=Pseudophaeobacter sp. C1-32P7 TaxID=3098142 RepID=UPI0034D3CAE9
MNVRIERIAYQIWWLTREAGGDCALADLAAFTGASAETCRNICMHRGWGHRYRRQAVAGRWRPAEMRPYQSGRAQDLTEVFV